MPDVYKRQLLEHPLLVADNNVRGIELDEALEAVVAVDDPAVEVVEVGGGEAATVKLHHGAQPVSYTHLDVYKRQV